MFKNHDIPLLIDLLEKQEVKIYHACQLKDFRSYLKIGGIPSRQFLENMSLPFTQFASDKNDRVNGDWDKVFVNISDFGKFFGQGSIAVPNVYGPILFQLSPKILGEAVDVAVCLKSAGSTGFCREDESLNSISDVERLFKEPNKPWAKKPQELQVEFDLAKKPSNPEISCTVEGSRLSLNFVELIRVDSYALQSQTLTAFVKEIVSSSNWSFTKIYERDQCPIFTKEIANLLFEKGNPVKLSECINNGNISQKFRSWTQEISSQNLEYQFNNFINYLFEGTIVVMKEESNDSSF